MQRTGKHNLKCGPLFLFAGNGQIGAMNLRDPLGDRRSQPAALDLAAPERVPVFLPGCRGTDYFCSWPAFKQTIEGAIAPIKP
jgi:hypothetical protein